MPELHNLLIRTIDALIEERAAGQEEPANDAPILDDPASEPESQCLAKKFVEELLTKARQTA